MRGPLFFLFVISAGWCSAQKIIVKNKADLYLSFGLNIPVGPKDYANEYPALISNMGAGNSFDLQYVQSVWKGIYIGGAFHNFNFSGWSHADNITTYTGTTVRILSAGPVIMLKTQQKEIRSSKKFDFFISIVPGFNQINTKTNPASGINNNVPLIPLTVKSTRFGIGLYAGLDFTLTTSIGFCVSAGYQNISTDSQIYSEKHFSFMNLKAGLFFRMRKDKKYRYSNL